MLQHHLSCGRQAFWLCLAVFSLAAFPAASRNPDPARLPLTALEPVSARQGWGQLQVERSVTGGPLQIGERTFASGLGTHAPSELLFELDGAYRQFETWVGVDAAMRHYPAASIVFKIIADDRELFDSGVMRADTPARQVSVSVTGVKELKLVVTDAGDGSNCDHADWAEPVLLGQAKPLAAAAPAKQAAPAFRVLSSGLGVELSASGEIVGIKLGGFWPRPRLFGGTQLAGCTNSGPVVSRQLAGAGLEFQRTVVQAATGNRATLTERFTPAADSVRWELAVTGAGAPWTTAIETSLNWPVASTNALQFWTAWDQPGGSLSNQAEGWSDPLVLRPLANRNLAYGANPWDEVSNNHYAIGSRFAVPLVMLADTKHDRALSVVLSPEDTMLETGLLVRQNGSLKFSRRDHRISSAHPVTFALDLVAHEADWRAALGWMVRRYPEYFNPPNPHADDVAGLAAYSDWEGELDTTKLRKMGFRTNWKASYDFPYMGMFLPPLADDEHYTRFLKGNTTSIAQLRDYSRRMRQQGFRVLNYFNVTEFGGSTGMPAQADPSLAPAERWRNVHNFLETEVADGILRRPDGGVYGSWEGCIAMDCGAPRYHAFLLEQARRHIDKLPDSSGICIDRMDWLRLYNLRADDGVTWRNGRPVRALSVSWRNLLAELGPLFHGADKTIFGNATVNRTDLMRHLDGIYHEFGHVGAELNLSALQCVRKPLMVWTPNEKTLGANPDAYFQRNLYLGAFPTAPLPVNDHTIKPSATADRWYLDYGPLFQGLRGRKWVLQAHALEVEHGPTRANLFEVPDGLVVPVCFGGTNRSAVLVVRNLSRPNFEVRNLRCTALHPGEEAPVAVNTSVHRNDLRLEVPLKRGCALVHIAARP